MKPERTIREAIPEDAERLGNCMVSAYSTYQKRTGGLRLPPMDVDYLSEIRNYPTWVVESEGRILAGLILVFQEDRASIANIAVDPEFQGHGIARELMAFAESKARENGYAELRLTTHILFDESISLYRHLGWVETGRAKFKVFMKKKL
jgi:ribosomal protein S18 acetylase RimI-like enzyme